MQMTITLILLGCAGLYLAWSAWVTFTGKSAGGCSGAGCASGGCSSKENGKTLLTIETPKR